MGKTETLAEVVVASARRGDDYVTWPGWYWPFHMVMCAAPEVVDWFSRGFYVSKSSDKDGDALSKKILMAFGGQKLHYQESPSAHSPVEACMFENFFGAN